MAQGRIGLGKLQLGVESTPGTPVAATTVWRGAASFIEDQRLVKIVEEAVGILGGTNRSYIPELMAGINLSECEASYEQLPYLLTMGWGMSPTGVADGEGDGFIFTCNVPTTSTASMTGRTYTVRAGDDHEVELVESAFCSDFSLKGAIREAIKMSGTLVGRQATQGSFTGALSLPSVEEVLMQKGKLYLDPIDDDYGTTQVSSQIVGFEISCKTGLAPQFTMDGTLYFTKILAADPEITGKITFLHDSAVNGASGEKNKWRSETPRSLQIKVEGSAFDMGDDYTNKTLIVNLPIKWTKFGALEQRDGATICSGEFVAKYDEIKGDAGQFVVVNGLTALT